MFLTRRPASAAHDERGAALLAAIGLTAVAAVIALTVTSSALFAVGYSMDTRAGVQAQAAAEGGIDFAAAKLGTAGAACQIQYQSTTRPVFTVDIYYSILNASPVPDADPSWMSGCPPTLAVQRLKLVSTGTADSSGLAANTSGYKRKVEAIYSYTLTAPPPSAGTGAAIYSYSQTDATINNLTINNAGGTVPTIQFLSGSFSCTSGSNITGNVILGSGVASLSSNCKISGNLYASGTINLQSATVNGDVSASDGTYPSVSLSNSAMVGGNVTAAGPVKVQGLVNGNVLAGPTAGVSVFSNGSRVNGAVKVAGTVSNSGTVVQGITQNQTGMGVPLVPAVPRWVDYPYAFSAPDTYQRDWPAFTEVTLSGSSCSGPVFTSTMTTVLASAAPFVVNAATCALDFSALSSTQNMNSDLVIVANSFKLSNNNFTSLSGIARKLWFIIPDRGTLNNHVPDCPSGGAFTMTNNVTIDSPVAAMIYSPCPITNSANIWRGQIYASSTKTSNAFTLNYLPIGLPNVNVGAGQNYGETPSAPIAALGSRTAFRTLSAG